MLTDMRIRTDKSKDVFSGDPDIPVSGVEKTVLRSGLGDAVIVTQWRWTIGGAEYEKRVWGAGVPDKGLTIYYKNSEIHRLTGPAVLNRPLGIVEYWVCGNQISENEFNFFYRTRPKPK